MPPTLQSIIAYLEHEGAEANRRGEAQSAVALYEAAVMLRGFAGLRLTVQQRKDIIKGVEHTAAARERISKSLTGKSPNMDAARAAGVPSLRQLAAKLGCTVSFLSQVIKGDRPMPPTKAEAFKTLTGKEWRS